MSLLRPPYPAPRSLVRPTAVGSLLLQPPSLPSPRRHARIGGSEPAPLARSDRRRRRRMPSSSDAAAELELQESGWEELRREARKLEGDLNVKLSSYARLAARSSASFSGTASPSADRSSWKSMEFEIQSLLGKLQDVNDAMSHCAASTAPAASVSQKLARHRDILHEFTQVRPASEPAPLAGSDRSPDGGLRRREFHLNAPFPDSQSGVRKSSKTKESSRPGSEAAGSGSRKSEGSHGSHVPEGRDSSTTGDKPMKVKLKFSRIGHNASAKPNPDTSDSRSSPVKPPRPGDSRHQEKYGNLAEGTKDSDRSTSSQDKKTRKERSIEETLSQEQPAKVQREPSTDPVRKSRRLAKKSILDSELDEDHDTSNFDNLGISEDMDGHTLEPNYKEGSSTKRNASKKAKSVTKVYEADNDFLKSRTSRDGKKWSRESVDGDNTEEEPTSDSELDMESNKQKSVNGSPANVRSEPLTTRRRALQSWMDGSSNSTVEFPDGLPPAASRSKKDKLSEEEMLAKKAEAAQRRRMQVEKATKESEAEAIRKILGLDSDKKKEERKQKEREEKERAARAQRLAGSTVRWVMGPTGTVISFPEAVGLPSIFNSKPHSYPPPREKCAGPLCTNVYRYRDSKLNLPLCSLKCYKAVHGNT